jgi:hypothetical protein
MIKVRLIKKIFRNGQEFEEFVIQKKTFLRWKEVNRTESERLAHEIYNDVKGEIILSKTEIIREAPETSGTDQEAIKLNIFFWTVLVWIIIVVLVYSS